MSLTNQLEQFLGDLLNERFASADQLQAFLLAKELQLKSSLAEFQGLYATSAILYPHQLAVAYQVLNNAPKGAILADEVGLGKTVEAGLILKELRLRDRANRVLITAPHHLLAQWQEELQEKFDLTSTVMDEEERKLRSSQGTSWWESGITLVSLSLFARLSEEQHQNLRGSQFDILVVDEAHRVRNRRTKTYRVLRDVKRDVTLLLSATPVHTHISELVSLVQLIDPYILSEVEVNALNQSGSPAAETLESFRQKLKGVMLRNRREDVKITGLVLPDRQAQTFPFELPEHEQALREAVSTYARKLYARGGRKRSFDVIALERLSASHPRALEEGLRRRLDKVATGTSAKLETLEENSSSFSLELLESLELETPIAASVDSSTLKELIYRVAKVVEAEKARQFISFLNELFEHKPLEKVVVFSEFLDTINALKGTLEGEGYVVNVFHGKLTLEMRKAELASFWATGQILILSEAGSEGQNLQRAHIVVNFDLPWNPMRLEQRIGRLHRIGQTRPVEVMNFVAKGTIEERLVKILRQRINLFEDVIGDLDAIIGEMERGKSFEDHILELALAAPGETTTLVKQTEEHIRIVADQYRLADNFDKRVLEKFDLSLREHYLELDQKAREGLDHLPLRRFLRVISRLSGVSWNPDEPVFILEEQAYTLSPQVAADGDAELLHPLHPAVLPLIATAQATGDVSRVRIMASESGMTYPLDALGKRGLLVVLKASWQGDAADELLLKIFIEDDGCVRHDLGDLVSRAPLANVDHLSTPSAEDLRRMFQACRGNLDIILSPHRERLDLEARRRFEMLARNIEKYYAEQLEALEQNFSEVNRQVRNARLELHHSAGPQLRQQLRENVRKLEKKRDDVFRTLPDKLMSLSQERDYEVREEQKRLKVDEVLNLVAIVVAEIA